MKEYEDIKDLCESEASRLFEKGLISSKTLDEYFIKSTVYTRNLGRGGG